MYFTCDQADGHPVDGQELHCGCVQVEDEEVEAAGGVGDFSEMVGHVGNGAFSYAHEDQHFLSEVLTKKYSLLDEWIQGNKLGINIGLLPNMKIFLFST